MKPRHWIACYVTASLLAALVGWLMGRVFVTVLASQIDRYFDNIHVQLLTLQSNITAQIRNAPPIVLPNPYVSNIVVTNIWITNTLSTLLVTNHGVWVRVPTNTPPLP